MDLPEYGEPGDFGDFGVRRVDVGDDFGEAVKGEWNCSGERWPWKGTIDEGDEGVEVGGEDSGGAPVARRRVAVSRDAMIL